MNEDLHQFPGELKPRRLFNDVPNGGGLIPASSHHDVPLQLEAAKAPTVSINQLFEGNLSVLNIESNLRGLFLLFWVKA